MMCIYYDIHYREADFPLSISSSIILPLQDVPFLYVSKAFLLSLDI